MEYDNHAPCVCGKPIQLAPKVVRVTAPNPGVMTGPGTNSYLIGEDELLVLDPGPDDPGHIQTLVEAGGGRISRIAMTHGHLDHAPGAQRLAELTGAEILGRPTPSGAEFSSPRITRQVSDGDIIEIDGVVLRALYTPGHSSDHLCYLLVEENLLFTGDHLMQGSTVVIAPPDGDMEQYMRSLRMVFNLSPPPVALLPGHGMWMDDPQETVSSVISHREMRERIVLEALRHLDEKGLDQGVGIDDMLASVYSDTSEQLYPIARYSLWAHLRKLAAEGGVVASDPDDILAVWRVASDR